MHLDLINDNIPLNGRIAIVDDSIEQALPLMELFSKLQIPYLYYSGNVKSLPEIDKAFNDIRVLFLDIYLTGNSIRSDKDVKSTLISVLNRILSQNNYPYLLIYWSRHEKEYNDLINNIFYNELKSKRPINILSISKSDYFDLEGKKKKDFDKKIKSLLRDIRKAISNYTIFSYLLSWENFIHISADNTVEEIFENCESSEWDISSKSLFYKLGLSYGGKNFLNFNGIDQIKSAFYSLNFVYDDSLENTISSISNDKLEILKPKKSDSNEVIYSLNKKLLLSDEITDQYLPGIIFELADSKNTGHNFKSILNYWINRKLYLSDNKKEINNEIKGLKGNERKKEKKKVNDKKLKIFRSQIRNDWKTIELNVTPICDYVQDKIGYFRLIPGIIINKKYRKYFNNSSEAVFISPNFKFSINDCENYFIILDLRYFTSISKEKLKAQPFIRVRQNLLAEIQSKLSRHINRQGILYLEE